MTRCLRDFYARRPDHTWKNVLSVGDSLTEKDALIEACFCKSQVDAHGLERLGRFKTIKFLEDPDLIQLTAELEVLASWLHSVTAYDGDVDLDLSSSEDAMVVMEKMRQAPNCVGAADAFEDNTVES